MLMGSEHDKGRGHMKEARGLKTGDSELWPQNPLLDKKRRASEGVNFSLSLPLISSQLPVSSLVKKMQEKINASLFLLEKING